MLNYQRVNPYIIDVLSMYQANIVIVIEYITVLNNNLTIANIF